MADLIRETGWYRLTDHGWERVDDAGALAEIAAMADGYQDLVYVTTAMAEAEVQLW
jgi:hypothetical protein